MNDARSVVEKANVWAWAGLVLLTAANIGSAYVRLGILNPTISFTIAAIKAAIVMVVFMQLRRVGKLTRLVAMAGYFWLAILMILMLADFLTRIPVAPPG